MKDAESLRILKSQLEADWAFILQARQENETMLTRTNLADQDPMAVIAVAYTLHNLYTALEAYFLRVAKFFENSLDEGGWHHQLVSRMALDIPGIRPALLGGDLTEGLDELRRFRHVFRNLYKSRLQPERVAFVQRYAEPVAGSFGDCHQRFVGWLDRLIEAEEG